MANTRSSMRKIKEFLRLTEHGGLSDRQTCVRSGFLFLRILASPHPCCYRAHMARRPRVFAAGILYHIIVRGNHREKTFLKDRDYQAYLELARALPQAIRRDRVCLLPYVESCSPPGGDRSRATIAPVLDLPVIGVCGRDWDGRATADGIFWKPLPCDLQWRLSLRRSSRSANLRPRPLQTFQSFKSFHSVQVELRRDVVDILDKLHKVRASRTSGKSFQVRMYVMLCMNKLGNYLS